MGFEKIIVLSCVFTSGDKRLMLCVSISVFMNMLTLHSLFFLNASAGLFEERLPSSVVLLYTLS